MYKRVLITLDGSKVSEVVLPFTTWLAGAARFEEVVLFNVLELGGDPAERVAEGYLRDRAAQVQKAWKDAGLTGPRISYHVGRSITEAPASVILRFAETNGIDLIALSTHGSSGLSRWLMGSCAEKIVRGADVPVLLVRATAEQARWPARPVARILAPVDGSELAHQALGPVETLARVLNVRVTLLHVAARPLPASGTRPGPSATALTREEEQVQTYLARTSQSLTGAGVNAEVKVRVGAPSEEIMAEARESSDGLVVISTHGRTGLSRWAMGSVADQVVRSSQSPVLLVRAMPKGAAPERLLGSTVRQCHNCGRITYQGAFTPEDRCGRCGFFLRACRNCVHYDSTGCVLRLPYAADTYKGHECPRFTFRESPIPLR